MKSLSQNLLRKRTYYPAIESGKVPTFQDVVPEWLDSINVLKNTEAITTVFWLLNHLLGVAFTIAFFGFYFSWTNLIWWLGFALLHAHFFHTFWYHRYCSHRAFKFRHQWFARLIYWLNPLCIKEEAYVIPHYVHHKNSDKPGDPYGPVNGYWGSFSATESANFMNRDMTSKEFTLCQRLLSHIPSQWNDEANFRSTGSFEAFWRYPVRFLVSNGFWITFFLLLGRPDLLSAWYFGALTFLLIMRDFNYRGHDEHVHSKEKLDSHSDAINQWIYGWLASEWHDNHHRFANSAKCGFAKTEIDVSFFFTKLLTRLGIIESYVDSSKGYEREIVRLQRQHSSH